MTRFALRPWALTTAAGLFVAAVSFAQDPPAEPVADDAAEPAQEAPAAVTYKLDAPASWLYVLVRYDRNATMAGHDHVVKAVDFDGKVTWNPADPSACAIDISFPVSALQVDPGNARQHVGVEGETAEGDKRKIKANLEGRHQLEADSHPNITYKSTSCAANGDRVDVTGSLNIHGVAKTVKVPMTIAADATSFKANGKFTLKHSDFGFEPFTALLGMLRNAPELEFVVNVKGAP